MARSAPLHDLPASTRGQVSMRVLAFAIGVALERRDIARGSPGRVRRVDARTEAAPTLRQTVVLLGAQRAVRWLIGSAFPWPSTPQRAHPERTRELERVRAEHPDDPRARHEALMRLHQACGPVQTSCLPAQIVPRVSQTPGFQAGYWLRPLEDAKGTSLVLYDTEGNAQAASQSLGVGSSPMPGVTVVRSEVRAVAASA